MSRISGPICTMNPDSWFDEGTLNLGPSRSFLTFSAREAAWNGLALRAGPLLKANSPGPLTAAQLRLVMPNIENPRRKPKKGEGEAKKPIPIDAYLGILNDAMKLFGVSQSYPRLTAFLAQVAVESDELRAWVEDPSPFQALYEPLSATEKTAFEKLMKDTELTRADLKKLTPKGTPAEINAQKDDVKAMCSYYVRERKSTMLGNTQVGDGERFRGRGPIQLTGRDNYAAASRAMEKTLKLKANALIDNPDLVATDLPIGINVAVWYASSRGKVSRTANALADGLTGAVTPYDKKAYANDQKQFEKITRAVNGGTYGLDQRWKYYVRAVENLWKKPAAAEDPVGCRHFMGPLP